MSNSASKNTPPAIMELFVKPYEEVWLLQKRLQSALISKTGEEALLFCEHPPTITLGTSAKSENVLASDHFLQEKGVTVFRTERGGDVTYHGPGQLVVYPILDLRSRKRDVNWYLRNLEQIVIDTLSHFGISGYRIAGKTGVWTNSGEIANNAHLGEKHVPLRKISSMGVRISRWCTMHGLSLNVRDCTTGFELINPCGFKDIEITSLEQEGVKTDLKSVSQILKEKFITTFWS